MPWWNKKVEELSKGMQQKVQFITTVVHQPKLLIFDEPFSGFDPINANLLKKEILFNSPNLIRPKNSKDLSFITSLLLFLRLVLAVSLRAAARPCTLSPAYEWYSP